MSKRSKGDEKKELTPEKEPSQTSPKPVPDDNKSDSDELPDVQL